MAENKDSKSIDPQSDPPRDGSARHTSGINKGRWQLALVVLVFLSPWIFAVAWKSSGRINHGTLIEPPRPLPEAALLTQSGEPGSAEDFKGKWRWVVLADQRCGDECAQKLDLVRQVRIAQKKNIKRLRYTLAIVEPESDDFTALIPESLLEAHPDLVIRIVRRDQHGPFLDEFVVESEQQGVTFDKIFVVDPLGNLMMQYDPGSEPKQLHQDMARLLKASHLG